MRIAVFGASGNVGKILVPALEAAGHEVSVAEPDGCDAAIDFTTPEAVVANIHRSLRAGVPVVVGTSGWDVADVDPLARELSLPVFFAPNFALGAVLLMRLAVLAAEWFEESHIIELHSSSKRDSPSATAKATAAAMGTNPPISSIRLPGLIAHQEVIFGSAGEVLTIRHDSTSRESFIGGVLLAVNRLASLPPGVTVGLEQLL